LWPIWRSCMIVRLNRLRKNTHSFSENTSRLQVWDVPSRTSLVQWIRLHLLTRKLSFRTLRKNEGTSAGKRLPSSKRERNVRMPFPRTKSVTVCRANYTQLRCQRARNGLAICRCNGRVFFKTAMRNSMYGFRDIWIVPPRGSRGWRGSFQACRGDGTAWQTRAGRKTKLPKRPESPEI
jgi:hypothetical protein